MKTNTYPNPWDLRYFQEIALTGNLSRAAERLGVGQPALSLALKRLEEGLEVSLFVRRNRGLTLTPAGRRLLNETNKLLADWAAIVSETKKSTTELVGQFTLGCHPSVAIYGLKNVLRSLYSNYTQLEVNFVHGLSRVICERVISGTIDFGVVVNPIRHPDLVIHKLALDEVAFWKCKSALADVLIYNPDLVQAQSMLKQLKHNVFRRTISSENLEVIASLADSGTGIAILPERVVKANAPQLRKIRNFPTYLDEVTFIYRVDLPKTGASQCIIDYMKSLRI